MHILFVTIVMTVILLASFAGNAAADRLTVIGFNKAPNYPPCTDGADMQQLTDGVVEKFPIWTKRGTVGWQNSPPIAIELKILDGGDSRTARTGTLQLHSAKGLYADVDLPRQVDVYTRDENGKLKHVGEAQPGLKQSEDKATHWLDVPVSAATDTLVVVLHAARNFIFVDEITWQPSGVGRIPDDSQGFTNIQATVNDSVRRFHEALSIAAKTKRVTSALADRALHAWIQDPWTNIDPSKAHSFVNNPPGAINIFGSTDEHEVACVGVASGKEAAVGGLRVTVDGLPKRAVKLLEVRAVVAANGQQVYDPLVPLGNSHRLEPTQGAPAYLWIDLDLQVLGIGTHRFNVWIKGNGVKLAVPGTVNVVASHGNNSKRLKAFNWAYFSDLPIFRDRIAAVRDLVAHGINVFVAHPADIPGIALDGNWNNKHTMQLSWAVEAAKEHGMVLLYLGWDVDKNPLGFGPGKESLGPAETERLLAWIGKIVVYLTAQGLSPDRWALYPVDEPRNIANLKLIKAISDAVKEKYPSLRIYADPTLGNKYSYSVSNLSELRNSVDYWQPWLGLLKSHLGSFFENLDKEWWLYSNPNSPAKLGSPLHDYRMLAWWAWQYGASGVGFWSYSDTTGSSAWVDIDGRRPDWAVVYESEHGIVTSRRWEAFREGLEDYALLSAHSKDQIQKALSETSNLKLDRWQSNDIEVVRRALLRSSFKP